MQHQLFWTVAKITQLDAVPLLERVPQPAQVCGEAAAGCAFFSICCLAGRSVTLPWNSKQETASSSPEQWAMVTFLPLSQESRDRHQLNECPQDVTLAPSIDGPVLMRPDEQDVVSTLGPPE